MSYATAIEGLYALNGELHVRPGEPRRKFRLEDMQILLAGLDDPQRHFPAVLVAGTNGKGSTAATLASILAAAGCKTGLYTSPHLARVNERVQILERAATAPDQIVREEIADDDFARLYFQVDERASRLVREGRLPDHSSFFETMTALAFLYFAEQKVNIAVLEVGMGGRLDATNTVDPLLSIVTDISLDHTEWLGSTIAAIAREKAGILRANGVLVTLAQHPEANQALGEAAVSLNVRGVNAAEYMPVIEFASETSGPMVANQYEVTVAGKTINVDSPLAGQHQQRNIALAIAAAVELSNNHGYEISNDAIELGIRATVWPGRLELLAGHSRRADILLDVAHNPAGAWALRSAISRIAPHYPGAKTLVFGCLRDKAVAGMAQILFPIFDRVVLTEVESPRTASLEELLAASVNLNERVETARDASAALRSALGQTPADGLIAVAGSVYLIGTLRPEIVAGKFE